MSTDLPPQVLILPGLGGDHRMCTLLLPLPHECVTPDYIAWNEDESLPAYATRFLGHLTATGVIDRSRICYILGISFGGPVGLEISRLLEPSTVKQVVLIGSLATTDELAGYVRLFARYIAGWLPEWVYTAAGHILPFVMRRISGVPKGSLVLLQDMYLNMPRRFFARASKALIQWEPGLSNVDARMSRIHGAYDHIIPTSRVKDATFIVPGAKHLVSISHTAKVRNILAQLLDRGSAAIT